MLQNLEVLRKMGKHTGITSECAVPMDSTNYVPISKRPPVTAQVVIGTPGTIKKWMSAKKLGFSRLKILVYDEADHMLDEVILLSRLWYCSFLMKLCVHYSYQRTMSR